MPQLKIKKSDITTKELPMDNLKSAVAFVKELANDNNETYIYSTVNDITRIENTVEIRKTQTETQWT